MGQHLVCHAVLLCCLLLFLLFFFFFFSSRRRHTRSDRDWSSDVCSSDLLLPSSSPCLCVSVAILNPCGGARTWTVCRRDRGRSCARGSCPCLRRSPWSASASRRSSSPTRPCIETRPARP